MPESNRVRFGILGCGTASIPVCEAITDSPLTELSGVYDINHDLANDLSRRFQVRKMETLDELLSDSSVDVVYVAVPHYLLAPLTRQILEAGKHALSEKPLAISLDEVDQLIELSSKRKLALGVFYEMRYAPAYGMAAQLIQGGALGKIVGVHIQTLIDKSPTYWQSGYMGRSVNPWRGIKAQAGGGVVLMNTSHTLDALFHITGLRVSAVSAEVENLVSGVEVEDTATATLLFDNGALGSLIAGAHVSGATGEESWQIFGSQGRIRFPDPYGSDPLRIYLKRPWGDFSEKQWHSIPTKPVAVHKLAIEDFARAVQTGECVPIQAHAARKVLQVVLAIYESAAKKTRITIS